MEGRVLYYYHSRQLRIRKQMEISLCQIDAFTSELFKGGKIAAEPITANNNIQNSEYKVMSAYLFDPAKYAEVSAYFRKFMTSFFDIEGYAYPRHPALDILIKESDCKDGFENKSLTESLSPTSL
jgi:hypothetical protein